MSAVFAFILIAFTVSSEWRVAARQAVRNAPWAKYERLEERRERDREWKRNNPYAHMAIKPTPKPTYSDEVRLTAQLLGVEDRNLAAVKRALDYNKQGKTTGWVIENDPAAALIYARAERVMGKVGNMFK